MYIEIDDDLAEAVEAHMRLDESREDVVRRLLRLGLDAASGAVRRPTRQPETGTRTRRVHGVTLEDLLRARLIAEGDELTFRETRRGITHTALVDARGRLLTDHGTESSPSTALGNLVGYSINGWKSWVHAPSGKKLSDLRDGLTS